MKFYTTDGKVRNLKNPRKYHINWDAPSLSKSQKGVKDFLFPFWRNDIVFEEFRIVGSRLSLDFYNANKKVAVEVQGAQHTRFVKHFHKNRLKYLEQLKRDQKKLDFCDINDITMVEIYPDDIVDKDLFERQGIYL